jgi:hypothetical protein
LRLSLKERPGDDPTLEHVPWDEPKTSRPEKTTAANPSASGASADPDFNPPEFLVAGHQTEAARAEPPAQRQGQHFTLLVSIQNAAAGRFSPRPHWVWGEITPLERKSGEQELKAIGPPFLVCDWEWESGRPVPIVRLDVGPWRPETTDSELFGELRLWFSLKDMEIDPTGEKTLADIAVPDQSKFVPIPDRSPVQYRAEIKNLIQNQFEVTVLEQHPDPPIETSSYDARRVELSETSDEIRREYYPNIGLVKHIFVYGNATRNELEQLKVRVYRAEEFKKNTGTVPLNEPLIIPVGQRR